MGQSEETDTKIGLLMQGLIDNLLGGFTAVIPGMVKGSMEALSDSMKDNANKAWLSTINEWVSKGFCDVDTGEILKRVKDETFPVGTLTTIVIRIQMLMMLIKSVSDVMTTERMYDLMSKTTPNPAPPEALVSAMMIDPARATENRDQMKRLGYSNTQIDNIILAHYRRVEEETIRTLYMRKIYTSDEMYKRMRELGYTDTRTAEIIQTWQLYPGPQDLFAMVAHEAFEPDIYKAIGLDQEFPSEQIPWLEAQGISKEWAMKYWISHWEQPSLEMGFEMLHRGIINRQELDLLFRIVEIPQYWRDKLMAITYNPYTRVDVRRMHELGVVDTQELVQAYQDLGYDGEKAVKMAEFTIRYNAEGDNKLTRSAILSSYHDDLISRSDALDMLTSQNLSRDVSDYYLTLEDYKITQESVKLYIDTFKERFLLEVDNETTTRTQLNKMGLRGSKIDALIDNWKTDLYKYQTLPSKSEITAMLIQKIITEGQWREIMTRMGYSFQHQGWYLKLIETDLTISATLPTKAELIAWFKKDIITETQFRIEMKQLGYSDKYIDLYLKSM